MTSYQKEQVKNYLRMAMANLYHARYSITDPMDTEVFQKVADLQDALQKLQTSLEEKQL